MRSSSPKSLRAKPPAMEAPRVLAMVFRLRMAELLSSMFLMKRSIRAAFFGLWCLRLAISDGEVLRRVASRREQRAEIEMVRMIMMASTNIFRILKQVS